MFQRHLFIVKITGHNMNLKSICDISRWTYLHKLSFNIQRLKRLSESNVKKEQPVWSGR